MMLYLRFGEGKIFPKGVLSMLHRLINRMVKDTKDEQQTRYAYGKLAGNTGIACNILLFCAKLLIGIFSSSIAIIADAFNNLSDAGSSIVTLVGFKLSAAPADDEHPFGHGRMEYLSALAVAALIIVAGFELGKSAVEKIITPTLPTVNWLTVCILVLAIVVKLWMAIFYRHVGKQIQSEVLLASYADSRNDVLCTAMVLGAALVSWKFHVAVDGYVGLLVALFVLWSGFSVIKDAVSPLLGKAPSPELVQGISETVLSFDGIIGIHDLIVHDYGPGRTIVSLHAEVSCDADIMESHDTIDLAERALMDKYHVIACIHMDPVDTDDESTKELRLLAESIIEQTDARLSLHDFRVVHGATHTNLIFDLVFPHDLRKRQDSVTAEIAKQIHAVDSHLFAVITPEQSFI